MRRLVRSDRQKYDGMDAVHSRVGGRHRIDQPITADAIGPLTMEWSCSVGNMGKEEGVKVGKASAC